MLSLSFSSRTPKPTVFVSTCSFRSSTSLCSYSCYPRENVRCSRERTSDAFRQLASLSDIGITHHCLLFYLTESDFSRRFTLGKIKHDGAFVCMPPWLLTCSHVGSQLLCQTFASLHNLIESEFLPEIFVEKPYA